MSPVLLRSRVASVPPPPPGAAFLQGRTEMHEYQVEVNWRGSTVTETIRANTPANAKSAILARYPGGTLRRIVRVG